MLADRSHLDSFSAKSIDKAPKMAESTRIREAYFTDFAEKVQILDTKIPIQLSGGLSFEPRSFFLNRISPDV